MTARVVSERAVGVLIAVALSLLLCGAVGGYVAGRALERRAHVTDDAIAKMTATKLRSMVTAARNRCALKYPEREVITD